MHEREREPTPHADVLYHDGSFPISIIPFLVTTALNASRRRENSCKNENNLICNIIRICNLENKQVNGKKSKEKFGISHFFPLPNSGHPSIHRRWSSACKTCLCRSPPHSLSLSLSLSLSRRNLFAASAATARHQQKHPTDF
jgi:hypothetical protein